MIQRFMEYEPQLHPESWVHPDATIIGQVTLAAGATVWPRAVLRGDMGLISIGEDTNIQDGAVAHVTSGLSTTRIGPRVTVGHSAILHGCEVEGDALIGMGSILLDNCFIAAGCVVGAGSLVPAGRRYPPNSLLMGSPARVVRPTTERDWEWIRHSWLHYKETSAQYRALG